MTLALLAATGTSDLEQVLLGLAEALKKNAPWIAVASLAVGVAFQVLKRLRAAWWRKLSARLRTTIVIGAGGVVSMMGALAAGASLRDSSMLALSGVIATYGYKLLRLWNVIDGFDDGNSGTSGDSGPAGPGPQ